MPNNYPTGTSTNQISLKIDVGTAATCSSTIFIKSPTGSQAKFTVSDAANNGSVPATNLGSANTLDGYMIEIQSIADFSALPANVAADIAADNTTLLKYLTITYTFNGGPNGAAPFTYEAADCVVSTNGSLASVVVYVSLTA